MSETRLASNTGLYRTRDLIGCRVESPRGEHLGTVEDFVIDLGEGFVAAAVLELGSRSDAGGRRVAVPISCLGYDPLEKKCLLNLTKDVLERAPFGAGDWPEPIDRVWAAEIYSHFGGVPYWY